MNVERLSLKDIAKKLNVSPSTISLVLHGKPGIGDATRAKVLQQLEEHGYLDKQPAVFNKSIYLLKYATRYFAERNDEFVTAIIDAIEHEARMFGIQVIMYACRDGEFIKLLDMLNASPLDGLILLGTELPPIYENYFKYVRFPVVLADSYMSCCNVNSVILDNERCIFDVVEYLYALGHRSIGYLHSVFDTANYRARHAAFYRVMEKFGLSVNPQHVRTFNLAVKPLYEKGLADLRDRNNCPTAFIASNDAIAFSCIKTLRDLGHRVPEDISIVGFDNVSFCKISDPPMTTIQIPTAFMGKNIAQLLYNHITTPHAPQCSLKVNGELIKRGSVCPPSAR